MGNDDNVSRRLPRNKRIAVLDFFTIVRLESKTILGLLIASSRHIITRAPHDVLINRHERPKSGIFAVFRVLHLDAMTRRTTFGIDEDVIIDFCLTFAEESNAAIRFFIGALVETLSSIDHRFQLSCPM